MSKHIFTSLLVLALAGCFPYVYQQRERVLIPGIDVDQTLDVAELELGQGNSLGLWAMRDQLVTGKQARRISGIYFENIEKVDSVDAKARFFHLWHLTWAISNLYRLGGVGVKAELEEAYEDAGERVESLDMKVATLHFKGDEIYMGDFHDLARSYARSHIVAPGNGKYLQSVEEYLEGDASAPQLPLTAEPTRSDSELLSAW
jgi:hypothetical protein